MCPKQPASVPWVPGEVVEHPECMAWHRHNTQGMRPSQQGLGKAGPACLISYKVTCLGDEDRGHCLPRPQ